MPKARKQKLKVFRTPIGFHDAFVAAPSQKAALEAWGASTNLFTAGTAELVTDDKLTKEPLARPGTVIKRARGSAKEHFEALGPSKQKKEEICGSRIKSGMTKKGRRPSRAGLEKAEAALAELEKRQAAERGALERELQELKEKQGALEDKQRRMLEKATEKRDVAEARYCEALADWEG